MSEPFVGLINSASAAYSSMNRVSRVILPTAALVISAGTLFAADSIELKQRWIAGKKYEQTVEQTEVETSRTTDGKTTENILKSTMQISQSVRLQADGKSKRMTVKWDRVAFERSLARGMGSYDSSKPNEATDFTRLGEFKARIAGKELEFLLSANDEITGIVNYRKFLQSLGSTPLGGCSFSQDFSEESVTRMITTGNLQAMPGHLVKPGDSWPFSTYVELMGPNKIGMNGAYTLKSIGDHNGIQCAEIVANATLSMDPGAANDSINGSTSLAQRGWKLYEGSLTGTIWLDLTLDLSRESQMTTNLKAKMKDPYRNDMDILTKFDFHTKLTAIEDQK